MPGSGPNIPGYNYNPPATLSQDIAPVKRGLLNMLTLGEYDHPGSTAQYWEAQAKSFDPRRPSNWPTLAAALLPSRIVPKELPSSVPGVSIVRVPKGGNPVDQQGLSADFLRPPQGIGKGSADIAYNAMHGDKVVGSIVGTLDPTSTYVHSVWVHPSFRNTTLFRDLIAPALARGKPIETVFQNKRLGAIAMRAATSRPNLFGEYTKVVK